MALSSLRLSLGLLVAAAGAAQAEAPPAVIASIKPVHGLVAAVMGDVGAPVLLVEGTASPHGYALKPSQAQALQDADVVFWVGDALETFLTGPIAALSGGARSAPLQSAPGVTLLTLRDDEAFAPHDHDHDSHDHDKAHDHEKSHDHDKAHDHGTEDHHGHADGAPDAHLWLDPRNGVAALRFIAQVLAEADPAHAAAYRANAAAAEAAVKRMEAQLAPRMAALADQPFLVFHDAYQYFEARFGLRAAGSILVSPETPPGARRLAEIGEVVKARGVACLFAEPQFAPKVVNAIADSTGVRTGLLDPLGADLAAGPGFYPALLDELARQFEACLGS